MSHLSFSAPEDRPAALVRRRRLGAVAIAILASLATSSAARATPAFEGVWSESIVTGSGACANGNGYAVRVSGGVLSDARHIGLPISGTVGEDGHVAWTVSRGHRSAAGSGRLLGRSG